MLTVGAGTVGGAGLVAAGCFYGAVQMGKGFATLVDCEVMSKNAEMIGTDFKRLSRDNLHHLVLQRGHGLEECLLRD